MDSETDQPLSAADPLSGMEAMENAHVAPAHVVASIALNMALKYHDIGTIKDGAMYQQYKLEGRNMEMLHLDMVFETAIKMEAHLLGSSNRIAKLIVDAIEFKLEDDAAAAAPESGPSEEPA